MFTSASVHTGPQHPWSMHVCVSLDLSGRLHVAAAALGHEYLPTSLTAAASPQPRHAASIKNATRCAVHRVCWPLFRTTDEKKVSTSFARSCFRPMFSESIFPVPPSAPPSLSGAPLYPRDFSHGINRYSTPTEFTRRKIVMPQRLDQGSRRPVRPFPRLLGPNAKAEEFLTASFVRSVTAVLR